LSIIVVPMSVPSVNQLIVLHIFQTNFLHMSAMWTVLLWATNLVVSWSLVAMTRRWTCGPLESRHVYW